MGKEERKKEGTKPCFHNKMNKKILNPNLRLHFLKDSTILTPPRRKTAENLNANNILEARTTIKHPRQGRVRKHQRVNLIHN